MKRRDFMKSAVVITGVQLARGERPQQSANGDRIENWVKQHPRLYFNQQAIARLRQRVKTDHGFKPRWSKLIERAETLVKAELVTEAMARQPARRGNVARRDARAPRVASPLEKMSNPQPPGRQDSWKVTANFLLNVGMRYDSRLCGHLN